VEVISLRALIDCVHAIGTGEVRSAILVRIDPVVSIEAIATEVCTANRTSGVARAGIAVEVLASRAASDLVDSLVAVKVASARAVCADLVFSAESLAARISTADGEGGVA